MLNLVTEAAANQSASSTTEAMVSQPYAMGMLMGMLTVFLFTLTVLREVMCVKSSHNVLAFFIAIVISIVSYSAVASGLPIAYGIWLSVFAPISMIWFFGQDNKHWLSQSTKA